MLLISSSIYKVYTDIIIFWSLRLYHSSLRDHIFSGNLDLLRMESRYEFVSYITGTLGRTPAELTLKILSFR